MSLTVYEIENERPVGHLAIATREEEKSVTKRLRKLAHSPWLRPETKIFSPSFL